MRAPYLFKPADFGGNPADICNGFGTSLYKRVSLHWSNPKVWKKGGSAPVGDNAGPCVYALIRNHGKSQKKNMICYFGLSMKPNTRFYNHPTARGIVNLRGEVRLSFAPVKFARGGNRLRSIKHALEEIEHILMWAAWQNLHNTRKLYLLPGAGLNKANAWHIENSGYRFSGQIPREIVFPWMLVKVGRNRSQKA
jgi:hypothetical protein